MDFRSAERKRMIMDFQAKKLSGTSKLSREQNPYQ